MRLPPKETLSFFFVVLVLFLFFKNLFSYFGGLELQVNYELFISEIINFNNNYLLIHKLAISTL